MSFPPVFFVAIFNVYVINSRRCYRCLYGSERFHIFPHWPLLFIPLCIAVRFHVFGGIYICRKCIFSALRKFSKLSSFIGGRLTNSQIVYNLGCVTWFLKVCSMGWEGAGRGVCLVDIRCPFGWWKCSWTGQWWWLCYPVNVLNATESYPLQW